MTARTAHSHARFDVESQTDASLQVGVAYLLPLVTSSSRQFGQHTLLALDECYRRTATSVVTELGQSGVLGPPATASSPHTVEVPASTTRFPHVSLTGYRLFNLVIILALGATKLALAVHGYSFLPTVMDFIVGALFTAFSYWIGLYGKVQPPVCPWFFHVDYSPSIMLVTDLRRVQALYAYVTRRWR